MTLQRFVVWVIGIVVLTAALASVWLVITKPATPTPVVVIPAATTTPPRVVAEASYVCDMSHTVKAVFMESTAAAAQLTPDAPPTPTGQVSLTLDTAPAVVLPQTISADGARYGTENGPLVFWSKGSGALVLQNGAENTYTNCIVVKDNPGGLSQIYHDGVVGFTARYQTDFGVTATYTYDGLGPKQEIAGVKFTIPASMASGTNLSHDSYISIEHMGTTTERCEAQAFLPADARATSTMVTENEVTYSFASSTGAAAGNRYEESVYALPGSQPCLAIRSLVHYGVFENYASGTVRAFDRSSLETTFASIRNSVTIVPQSMSTP